MQSTSFILSLLELIHIRLSLSNKKKKSKSTHQNVERKTEYVHIVIVYQNNLTHSLIHHFETFDSNSKKLQTRTGMWLLKDF